MLKKHMSFESLVHITIVSQWEEPQNHFFKKFKSYFSGISHDPAKESEYQYPLSICWEQGSRLCVFEHTDIHLFWSLSQSS